MEKKLLLKISEAADALGVGRTFAYELVLSGQLPSIKLGRARRVPLSELEKYIARLVEESREGVA